MKRSVIATDRPVPHALAAAAALLLAGAMLSTATQAQTTAPDSGQILQQNQQRAPAPPQPAAAIQMPAAESNAIAAGGAKVTLQAVQFSGNSALSSEALQALVAGAIGQALDLAGLRALADGITAHYRAAGYPFARAVLPPQSLADGQLRINLIEGRYSRAVVNTAEPAWLAAAQAQLSSLKPGEVITTGPLERAVLALSDLPGVRATATMQPGDAPGTGELVVDLSRSAPLTGLVSLDNHGNRYSGQHRLLVGADWNSPFRLGDQLSLRLLGTDESLWLGSVTYASPVPWGNLGLRASASLAHTSYELGKEFNALGATGTADVASLGLSWPVLRSSTANLRLSAQLQHKRLHDQQITLDERKQSTSLPLSLDFDLRDNLAGGGLSYGSLSWTPGRLKLSSQAVASDVLGTHGSFSRLNIDVVRQQTLTPQLQAWVRGSGQWTDGNLDSSERVSLGGANGVRAYPSGEATGDQGWLVQAELRTQVGPVAPFAFADAGVVRINARPLAGGGTNQRKLAGGGIGVRWQAGSLDAQLALAWRSHGGPAQSDGGSGSQPRVWGQVAWRF